MSDRTQQQGLFEHVAQRWEALPNIDLAARVIETEFFRYDIVPAPAAFAGTKSIVVIAPHQDDEVIGVGGTLLLAREEGVSVSVVFLTDGVVTDQETRYTDDEWKDIRDQEAREVCALLGAKMYQLGISNRTCHVTPGDLFRLSDLILELNPEVMFVPWLLDAPAKHRYANHLLFLAHRLRELPETKIWSYQVHNTIYANAFADITAVADAKLELLRCYRSQNELCRRYDHQSMGLAAWNSRFLPATFRTMGEQYVELFYVSSSQQYFDLVSHFYLSNLQSTYRGHPVVTEAAVAIDDAVSDALQRRHERSDEPGR